MIHLPYFEKLLSFAIRGLRVTAILGGTLPLFTEPPRRGVLGNPGMKEGHGEERARPSERLS
jgi:hypothetical protein